MKEKNDISLVIIAKNEALGLEKAIKSCRDFVDEVIVAVDDKSTDNTMEVAKRCADVAVFYTWENSFCKARNYAQSLVKTKWAFFLDGHEFVGKIGNIKDYLKKDIDGIDIRIVMETGFFFYFPRIVRKEVIWESDVHNKPVIKTETTCKDFIIIHDRDRGQNKEAAEIRGKQRSDMVVNLMKKQAKRNPKDSRPYFYLGNQHLDMGKLRLAIKYYKKCIKRSLKKGEKWLAYYNIALCCHRLGKWWNAIGALTKAEKELPNRWETAKLRGITYIFIGWYPQAVKFLADSFKINTGDFAYNPMPRNDAQTWDFIGICLLKMKDNLGALTAWRRALEIHRTDKLQRLSAQRVEIIEQLLGIDKEKINPKEIIELCLVACQRPHRIPIILKQLLGQTTQKFRINIWNNSSQQLDTSGFPRDKIEVIDSNENIGSQARFRLAKETTGNPIIFFDDDEDLQPNFVEYNYQEYLNHGPNCILGWFTRIFDKESYWHSRAATYNCEADYIGTGGMVLDRNIIDKEPLLQNIPEPYNKTEDLYLSYLARTKYNMRLVAIEPTCKIQVDQLDQYKTIDKEKIFKQLRATDWWLLIDKEKKEK